MNLVKREFVFNATRMKERRRRLRRKSTESEELLWKELRNGKLGVKFKRQYSLGNYVVDFFCREKKIAIEVDGGIHLRTKIYDIYRDRYLESMGIKTIRINNSDVEGSLDEVVKMIAECLARIGE